MDNIPPGADEAIMEANRLAWKLREYAGFNVPILLVLLAVIGLSLGVLFLPGKPKKRL